MIVSCVCRTFRTDRRANNYLERCGAGRGARSCCADTIVPFLGFCGHPGAVDKRVWFCEVLVAGREEYERSERLRGGGLFIHRTERKSRDRVIRVEELPGRETANGRPVKSDACSRDCR